MKLYLVRHGQTDWNIMDVFQGTADIPLNKTGKSQATKSAKILSKIQFDVVYSSPLSRAKETCEIILKHNKKGGTIILDERLKERRFGDYEGTPVSRVPDGEHGPWWNFKNEFFLPNGESIKDVEQRVSNFINEIKKLHAGKTVLVTTHGGVLRMIHYMLNEKPEDGNLRAYNAANAEIVQYDF